MAVLKSTVFAQSGAASLATLLAMLVLTGMSSAQDSSECAIGVDVTSAPYGADSTGAADSSSAFNAAIIAAGGAGTVCIPTGTYMVLKDINLDIDGVTVTAPSGATIKYGNNMQFFVRGNGNKLQNINVDCANTAFSGFVINGAGNSITDCSAMNCGSHGFVFDGQNSICAGNFISGCTASNNREIGIAQNKCNGNSITGNTATSNHLEGITADNQSQGGQVVGNTISGNCISGGVGGMGVDFCDGLVISGNTFDNNALAGLKTQNNLGPSRALNIFGNKFTDNAGVAVWLFCNAGQCTVGSTVTGNSLTGNAATGNKCNGMVQDDSLGNIVAC